jgi:hypothetical protein
MDVHLEDLVAIEPLQLKMFCICSWQKFTRHLGLSERRLLIILPNLVVLHVAGLLGYPQNFMGLQAQFPLGMFYHKILR